MHVFEVCRSGLQSALISATNLPKSLLHSPIYAVRRMRILFSYLTEIVRGAI